MRGSFFIAKDFFVQSYYGKLNSMRYFKEIQEFMPEFMGYKEQSLVLDMLFGASISMASGSPMTSMLPYFLSSISNYFELEENYSSKMIGGGASLGLSYLINGANNDYAAHISSAISGAYTAQMLSSIRAVKGILPQDDKEDVYTYTDKNTQETEFNMNQDDEYHNVYHNEL